MNSSLNTTHYKKKKQQLMKKPYCYVTQKMTIKFKQLAKKKEVYSYTHESGSISTIYFNKEWCTCTIMFGKGIFWVLIQIIDKKSNLSISKCNI